VLRAVEGVPEAVGTDGARMTRAGSPSSVALSASAIRPSVNWALTAAYFLALRVSSSKALITSSVTSTSGAP
jgi:hypothetical protein